MKRIVSCAVLLLVCLLLVQWLPGQTGAAGTNNLTFTLNSDQKSYAVTACEHVAGVLEIPSTYNGRPVTRIGRYAFSYCDALTEVRIPQSVTVIEEFAFLDCAALTSVNIPTGVTEIPRYTFCECTSLTDITIPEKVKTIGNAAFAFCESLTQVSVGKNTTQIMPYVFSGCKKLSAIWVDAENPAFSSDDQGLLYNKAKTELWVIPGGKTGSCTIPAGVTVLQEYALYDCNYLTAFRVDAENPAFSSDDQGLLYDKTMTTLLRVPGSVGSQFTVPAAVTTIVSGAFDGRTTWTDVYFDGTVERWDEISPLHPENYGPFCRLHCAPSYLNYQFSGDAVTITGCDKAYTGDVEIPATYLGKPVTAIAEKAFYECADIVNVTVPAQLTQIAADAFLGCTGLECFAVDGDNPAFSNDAQGALYNKTKTVLLRATRGKWGRAESEFSIPGSVTEIGDNAFADLCPESVSYQGMSAQWKTVRIGSGNEVLQTVQMQYIPVTCTIENGEVIITGCDQNYRGVLTIPATIQGCPVTQIAASAFYSCNSLTSVTIPDSVRSIGEKAFRSCSRLTEIRIPAAVTDIGAEALAVCTKLTGIWVAPGNPVYASGDQGELMSKDQTVLLQAPGGLSGSYTVPQSVKVIADRAFASCNSLTSVVIGDGVETIGTSAFSGCRSLTSVVIGDGVETIGASAFANCSGLTQITLGSSVTTVGEKAFDGCQALTTVYLPGSITQIASRALGTCNALTDVYYGGTQEQWKAVTVGSGNWSLQKATVHCQGPLLERPDGFLLTADHQLASLTVEAGKTLDLGGYVLTVDSLASFGQIIDSVGGGGLIAKNIEMTGNQWLPIPDSTGCYRFYRYEVENLGIKPGADSAAFGFALQFEDAAAYAALLECEDVQVTVTMSAEDSTRTYAFRQELLAKYVSLVEQYPHLRPCLKLTVTGVESLPANTVVTVTPGVSAMGGKVQNSGQAMQYVT